MNEQCRCSGFGKGIGREEAIMTSRRVPRVWCPSQIPEIDKANQCWDSIMGQDERYVEYKDSVTKLWAGLLQCNPSWVPTKEIAMESITLFDAVPRPSLR